MSKGWSVSRKGRAGLQGNRGVGVRRNERKERDRNSRRVKEKRGDDGGGGREVRQGIQAAVRSGDKCLSKKIQKKKTKRNHHKR